MKYLSPTEELQILRYEVSRNTRDNTWTAVKGLHCVTATTVRDVMNIVKKDLVKLLK